MKYCLKCKWSSDKKFCYLCGRKMLDKGDIVCSRGHHINNPEHDRFCEECGEITELGKRIQDEKKSPIRENFDADEYLADVAADNDRETLAGV